MVIKGNLIRGNTMVISQIHGNKVEGVKESLVDR